MKKKLNNIVIINDFNYTQGGASKVAIDTANLLAKNDYNVYFFSCSKTKSSELDSRVKDIYTGQGESLTNKNKIRGFFYNIYNKKAKKMLKNLLKDLDPKETIIHVHGWTKSLSSSVFKCIYKMNYKMVLTLHDYFVACPNGGFYNYKKEKICNYSPLSLKCIVCNCDSRNYFFKIYRIFRQFVQNKIVRVSKKTKNVITISKLNENVLRQYLPNANFTRIYNPIDYPVNMNNDLHSKEYYLYVGRVDKEKGVDDFCKCITELNLKGIVVGSGSELDSLSKQYPQIDFVGWKSKEEIIKYLDKSKAFVFPSKWYETAGLTILEAQYRGVFCYVRSSCAGREFIKEGKNGCLFDNLEDLKNKICKYNNVAKISEPDFKTYSVNNYYELLLECYKKTMTED